MLDILNTIHPMYILANRGGDRMNESINDHIITMYPCTICPINDGRGALPLMNSTLFLALRTVIINLLQE